MLIGGEAYLHPGFVAIIRALAAANIRPTMTTGGRGITAALATQMAQAGMASVSVSIDGTQRTHDLLRAVRGGFDAACRAVGLPVRVVTTANTNVNQLNLGELVKR